MAKTKVYFWLKVDKKFFDNLFIKRLKQIPGGYTMIVIYIRLMLESLEDDCILYYEGYFDNLVQELALKLDVTEDDINMTMVYFTKCGLIQIDDDGHATLSQAKAMVESETNWAKYKREKRKKISELPKLDGVQQLSNSCPIEIEKEKKLNKESDLDINKEYIVEQDTTTEQSSDFTFPEWLNEKSISELKKCQPQNYKLYIPVQYLNQETNSCYRFVERHIKLIKARYSEGYTLEDFKKVIDNKVTEWGGSAEWSKYLRPETLFKASKFENYLNQKIKVKKSKSEDNFPDLPF